MKNCIILILTIALAYFICKVLGVFDFGSLIVHDTRVLYAKDRAAQVALQPQLKIGVVINPADGAAAVQRKGLEKAVAEINQQGGILGKSVELQYVNASNLSEHNNAIQELCKQQNIALCIGPFNSDYIPSMRCLSQFQSLPLVSPSTVFSDKLPPLSEENFISFFPPLSVWTGAIVDDMEEAGYKDVLLISPEENSYGDIFATDLEREGQIQAAFNNIYRINYQKPFSKDHFSRVLRYYAGKHLCDAVVFTGEFEDFMTFSKFANEHKIALPLYGTDDLNVEELAENLAELPAVLRLPYAVYGEAKDHNMAHLGYVTMMAIAKAIKARGSYDPLLLIDDLYQYRQSPEYAEDNPVSIQLEVVDEQSAL